MRIRSALPSDLPRVRDLLRETWHHTYDPIYGAETVAAISERWHSLAVLGLQVSQAGTVFLVTESADKGLLATALVAPGQEPGIVEVRRLYVAPAAQGRGIGRRLLAEGLARFPAARVARLEVEPRNSRAIAFYERLEFRAAGRVEHCGGASTWAALVMERDLAT